MGNIVFGESLLRHGVYEAWHRFQALEKFRTSVLGSAAYAKLDPTPLQEEIRQVVRKAVEDHQKLQNIELQRQAYAFF